MAPVHAPGNQNVADDTANSTAWNKYTLAFPPNSIQLVEKSLVVVDSTELAPTSIRGIGL
jgi:hypothetical protein